jgi:hypothetical protein
MSNCSASGKKGAVMIMLGWLTGQFGLPILFRPLFFRNLFFSSSINLTDYKHRIRFAAMLADSITISGKSLMGFGSGGHYSIEHLLLTSA